jgi:acyl carrier protein
VSSISEKELIERVIGWIRSNHRPATAATSAAITEETDLLATGLLDSFGFVDLILFIESQNDCEVDLTHAEPKEFSVVKGLCRLALTHPG